MLRNYFTVALRNLARHRLHSAINIGGLAVGLAACLLILLYVRDELSYERWLPNADRIAIVETTFNVPGRDKLEFALTPGPVKPAFDKDFGSDLERTVRTYRDEGPIRIGDQRFLGAVTYCDPGCFDVFDLPMVSGAREPALANTSSVILSQTRARMYFGDRPAVGQTITVGDGTVLTVVGVFADLPKASHLDFQAIARFDASLYKDHPNIGEMWTAANVRTYVLARSSDAIARLDADMPAFVDRNVHFEIPGLKERPSTLLELDLLPLLDIHLHASKPGYTNTGSIVAVVAFVGLALLILVIACINFVNLATARAMTRAREVALRKVMGATRGQLVRQHLGEAVLTATIALIVALALVELALGPFNAFLHKELRLDLTGDPALLATMLGLIAIVGAVGGLYPAVYLSRFQPAVTLKANQSSAQGSTRLRTALVVIQFAVSITLMICTAVIYTQTVYARTFDAGFARDRRVMLTGLSDLPKPARATLKRELAAVPGVRRVALSSDVPPLESNNNALLFPTATITDEKYIIEQLSVDGDFFDLFEVRPVAGRLFSADRAGDIHPADIQKRPEQTFSIVINEAFATKLGAQRPADVIGRDLWELVDLKVGKSSRATIVGVVPDLHLRSVRVAVTPMVYFLEVPEEQSRLTLEVDADHASEILGAIEPVWNRVAPMVPLRASFIDDNLRSQYDTDEQRGKIFAGFATFAILIACLGLFGLASFSAQRRTKEIGMRKVLGASVLDIVRLLVWQFSRPVLIASALAWPIAYYVMRRWLAGFEDAISLTDPRVLLGIFGGATIVAVAIAWATTAGHALRVARAHPARALRVE
jgi:putative ABC transport system permease protein